MTTLDHITTAELRAPQRARTNGTGVAMGKARNGAMPASGAKTQDTKSVGTKTVNLALQGGGAHGAFAWGVLDRLLEDDRIAFEGISATSAAPTGFRYSPG